MKVLVLTSMVIALACQAGCEKPPPPRFTADFMKDPILLEATMVKCARDRSRTKYEKECVNAREAVNRIASAKEAKRQQELDRQSERKRRALRQAQLAATEARQRAAEVQRLREEAEYLEQFEALTEEGVAQESASDLRVPDEAAVAAGELTDDQPGRMMSGPDRGVTDSPADATQVELPAPAESAGGDLEAVREQLKERQVPPSDG